MVAPVVAVWEEPLVWDILEWDTPGRRLQATRNREVRHRHSRRQHLLRSNYRIRIQNFLPTCRSCCRQEQRPNRPAQDLRTLASAWLQFTSPTIWGFNLLT